MKKRKGVTINIHLTNRWLYTFIVLGILIAVCVGIYAATYASSNGVGHEYSEIKPCANGEVLKVVNGVWACASPSAAAETDPTVKTWAKDDTQDIATYGNLKIMRKYRYDFSGEYCTFYGSTPRCPPDVSATVDELLEKTFYTNIDTGAVCYDYWKSSSTQQNIGCKYKKNTGQSYWVVNELKYQYS